MPVQEKIPAGSARPIPPPSHKPRRDWQRVVVLLWLLITIVMLTVGVVMSRGDGKDTCTGSSSATCSNTSGTPAG
jgi:hypothetical protein